MSDQKSVPMGLKFAFGGLSGAGAACCVQPMDLVKNRMQVCASYDMSHINDSLFKIIFRCPEKVAVFVCITTQSTVPKPLSELKVFLGFITDYLPL